MKGISEMQHCWNERLRACISNCGYTQTAFADALNAKYGTQFTQKTISRWVTLADASKDGIAGFPEFKNMIYVADLLEVDIGYLIGETDAESFSLEKVCNYTGLNDTAVTSICSFTQPKQKSGILRANRREAFNKFLSAQEFSSFFYSLLELYQTSIYPQHLNGKEFEDIDSAIDFAHDTEERLKYERYLLSEALILLSNELFPKPDFSHLPIKEAK